MLASRRNIPDSEDAVFTPPSPDPQRSEPVPKRQLDAVRRRASLEGGMAEATQARVIKRYANRKLYDTQDSKYVTLDRIAELVRNGEEVKVLDNKSKNDLTKVTLAQIIYEEQKSGNATAWSVQNLRGFIQEGREKLVTSIKEGPVGKLVGRAEELGAEVKSAADDRVRGVMESAAGTVKQLQGEVQRLQARIEELEAKLRQAASKDDPPEDAE